MVMINGSGRLSNGSGYNLDSLGGLWRLPGREIFHTWDWEDFCLVNLSSGNGIIIPMHGISIQSIFFAVL